MSRFNHKTEICERKSGFLDYTHHDPEILRKTFDKFTEYFGNLFGHLKIWVVNAKKIPQNPVFLILNEIISPKIYCENLFSK